MLIKCPECGAEISDKARSCPRCGYSLEDEREQKALIEAALRADKQRAAYDATFMPNELYLAAPMPFKVFCRPFTARGRATRAEYWSGFVVFLVSTILAVAIALRCSEEAYKNPLLFIWVGYGTLALTNATYRRLHDAGASDVLAVVLLFSLCVPVFGWTLLFLIGGVALFSESVAGSNEHGPHPDTFYRDRIGEPEIKVPINKFGMKSKAKAKTLSRSVEERHKTTLSIVCPHCGERCEVPGTVADGQHILCPYCENKFSCRLSV